MLAVDHGTTTTVGATAEVDPADGWVRVGVVEVGGTTAVPSVVLSRADGTVLAGVPAAQAGHDEPAAAVARSRSHLAAAGGARQVLADAPRPTTAVDVATALVASFLRAERARRSTAPAVLVLLHPATWADAPREALRDAGRDALAAAGATGTRVVGVPGPEALAHRLGGDDPVLVADLGGGGTELAVVAEGRVVRARSVPVGAEALDDALADLVLERARPELASRIRFADDPGAHRAWYALRSGVRAAKETLGATGAVDVPLPGHPPVRLTHDDLTRLLGPGLEQVAEAVRSVATAAGGRPRLLVRGGLAELPRVRDWLARRTGLALVAVDDAGVTAAHGPVSGAAARAVTDA